jgi:glycosyltransferase involved in cell wall biosynthesis
MPFVSQDDTKPERQSEPVVSVVMAAYNYDQYIGQAIQSVIDQTWTDWELIIIDDGSNDSTEEVVKPFLSDDRIQYHRQENQGQPKAKNAGIRRAKASFIAFLDADDAWHPGKLEKQMPLFEGNPKVGVTYTGVTIIDEKGNFRESRPSKGLRGDVFKESFHQSIPGFSASIVRKEVFEHVGMFNESIPLAIDFELWLRVAMHYHFDFIDEPLVYYRTGHANLSKRYQERRRLVVDKIIPYILNECGGRERLTNLEIRENYARLFAAMSKNDLSKSQWSALYWGWRAILAAPWKLTGWRGVVRACIPNSWVRGMKCCFLGKERSGYHPKHGKVKSSAGGQG